MVAAQITAPLGRRLDPALEGEARSLTRALPYLAIEARRVAAHIAMGIHGRRRAGAGEDFWQFRPYMPEESASRVDWRRSARDDRLYVREREWQSASTYWLWVDCSHSMHYVSTLARQSKRDRAIVLALATADLLVRGGERVGLAGLTPPLQTRAIIDRLAEGLILGRGKLQSCLPEGIAPGPRDRVIVFSDFILPVETFRRQWHDLAVRGASGIAVQIRDPAETLFPFHGEMEFEGPEDQDRWRVGDAAELGVAYRNRLAAHESELRHMLQMKAWQFLTHGTDHNSVEGMLAIAALVQHGSGNSMGDFA